MTCDMKKDCQQLVTHIGEKGYIYCREHAIRRRQSGYERTRRMQVWELKLIKGRQSPTKLPTNPQKKGKP